MEFPWKKDAKPVKTYQCFNRKKEMDLETKRVTREYPFLSKEQIINRAKQNINAKKRASVYEFDADSDGETSFPKKKFVSKSRTPRIYSPLSVITEKVKVSKKRKVVDVIELSSDSETEFVVPRSSKNPKFVDWRSVRIKKEPEIDWNQEKSGVSNRIPAPKLRENDEFNMRSAKNKMESNFDKLRINSKSVMYNKVTEPQLREDSDEDYRPFAVKNKKDFDDVQINGDKYSKTAVPKTREKKDEEDLVPKKDIKKKTGDKIQVQSGIYDKSIWLQPGVNHSEWEIRDSLNSEQLKIKTEFSDISSDSEFEEESNYKNIIETNKKYFKIDSENFKIKRFGRGSPSLVDKYRNPHFSIKNWQLNASTQNQTITKKPDFPLFHRKILTNDNQYQSESQNKYMSTGKGEPQVFSPKSQDNESPKNQTPIKPFTSNAVGGKPQVNKNTALTKKLQDLKETPEEAEEERKMMDSRTLRTKRVSFGKGGFLCELFD